MSVKDILAIVLSATQDDAALRAAESLAGRFGQKLSAAFLTALPDEPVAYEPSVVAGVWAELLARARQDSATERTAVEARLKALAYPCEMRTGESLSRDLGRVAAVHARYADVAITTRPKLADYDARNDVLEGVLFYSGRPVLAVPPDWQTGPIGRRPMLAWDASREATRALSEADWLIEGADNVTVLTIDAKSRAFGHGAQPGENIAAHLRRRGLNASVVNVAAAGRTPSQTLQEESAKIGADLVVMGGYHHARLREMVFGGATREMLGIAKVPLLLAH
jgi:nucleotide-binding universal stress UspA family protein